MSNYYNEFDPAAAAWLRELIKAGHLPAGDVDERSVEDVVPGDIAGYTQCHFFAGIGGWSLALALAGWPVDRPVWTGSCPCQPFSAAGKGAGFDDQRHLWPAWFHLIRECRPTAIFGEQVASKAADPWIDLVHADLEGVGYAFGCVPFPAAGVGAPHIRDRTYWMGYSSGQGLQERQRQRGVSCGSPGTGAREAAERAGVHALRMADADGRNACAEREQRGGEQRQQQEDGRVVGLADTHRGQRNGVADGEGCQPDWATTGRVESDGIASAGSELLRTGPLHGFWTDADWLGCRDGKWRPVEPSTFPLAHGLPARMGRLRGYGNAIVPQQAAEFVLAAEEALQMERKEAA